MLIPAEHPERHHMRPSRLGEHCVSGKLVTFSLVEVRGTTSWLRKLAGPEKSTHDEAAGIVFHESEYQRLRGELQAAHDAS